MHVFSAGPGEVVLRLVRVPVAPVPAESERFFYIRPGVDYLVPFSVLQSVEDIPQPPCRIRAETVSVEPADAQIRVSADFRPECARPGAPTVLDKNSLMTRAEVEEVRAATSRGSEIAEIGLFGGRGPFRWAGRPDTCQICGSPLRTCASPQVSRNPELSARVQANSPLVAAAAALARSQCELDLRGDRGRFGPLSPTFTCVEKAFPAPSSISSSQVSYSAPSGDQVAGAAQALMRQKVAFPAAEAFVRRAHELAGLLVPGTLQELIRAGVPVTHPLPGDVVVQRGGPFVDVGISLGNMVYVSAKTGFPELYRFWPDRGSARRFWV